MFGIYFVYRTHEVQQRNKNHETIPSRLFPEQNKGIFCFTSSVSGTHSREPRVLYCNLKTKALNLLGSEMSVVVVVVVICASYSVCKSFFAKAF